jgi:hypothetical protein
LYHSSSRVHSSGTLIVAGCVSSVRSTFACWNWSAPSGWLLNHAPPFMSPFQAQLRSALASAWMATMPPPRCVQRSNAVRWAPLRMPSPSSLRNTTTS